MLEQTHGDTGVLTFDGNVKLKQKATYEGIRLSTLSSFSLWHCCAIMCAKKQEADFC